MVFLLPRGGDLVALITHGDEIPQQLLAAGVLVVQMVYLSGGSLSATLADIPRPLEHLFSGAFPALGLQIGLVDPTVLTVEMVVERLEEQPLEQIDQRFHGWVARGPLRIVVYLAGDDASLIIAKWTVEEAQQPLEPRLVIAQTSVENRMFDGGIPLWGKNGATIFHVTSLVSSVAASREFALAGTPICRGKYSTKPAC